MMTQRYGLPSAIGNTPLVELVNIAPSFNGRLFAKLELLNPGGSMKDRPSMRMVQKALERGYISPGGTVVESSSGNMGIGLAQACAYYNLNFICVVDERTSTQSVNLMKSLGAQVKILTTQTLQSNTSLLEARLSAVHQILEDNPTYYWTNQYANIENANSYHTMMEEIRSAVRAKIDYIFCATGTCGTIRGCADYIHSHPMNTKVIAVDAEGSVIFGGEQKSRLIPGHGASVRPQLFDNHMYDAVIKVDDKDCVRGCRILFAREGILAGGSSGALIVAFQKYVEKLPSGATVVVILPDRGDRYLDTIYNDKWVDTNLAIKYEDSN